MILFWWFSKFLLCIYFNYASEGAVGRCWFNEILGEEKIENHDELSDNIDNLLFDKNGNWLSSGAVGCCCGIDNIVFYILIINNQF